MKHAWPPALTWDRPAAYDSNGVACYATTAWLEAHRGPREEAAAEISTTASGAITDRELDEILGALGYERAA